jgi:hypothetical protein
MNDFPTKNKKRAERRYRNQVQKQKAIRFAEQSSWFMNIPEEAIIKNADHLASCSCWVCGNPRKHFNELTIQEKRAILSEHDE